MTGKVLIFSAPSGAGKSTIVGHLLKIYDNFEFSVSATSRAPRGEEKDGVEYYFLTPEKFRELIAQDAFVEHEEVYEDKFYGPLKSEVERIWAKGHGIVFDGGARIDCRCVGCRVYACVVCGRDALAGARRRDGGCLARAGSC